MEYTDIGLRGVDIRHTIHSKQKRHDYVLYIAKISYHVFVCTSLFRDGIVELADISKQDPDIDL